MTVQVDQIPDVITTAVVQNGLVAAAKEMSTTLERAAYNPLLFELKDYSAVITDAAGRLWAEAPGLIAFITPLPELIRYGVKKFGPDGFEPDDVIIANDPFTTGTHISDTTTYMPIFTEGSLVGFAATTAHWADIGGKTPGGWCPDSIDVFQEGLRFTHQKLYRAGVPDETLHEVIMSNVRLPETVRGDLEAQVAAIRTGAERVQALCTRYGVDMVRAAMVRACDESERSLRAKIAALPDGEYVAEKLMDHDGVEKDLRRLVRVKLTIDGDRVIADFTGSSPRTAGPINLPFQASVGAINAALKSVLAPTDAANDGELRVLEVIAPEDSVVNPSPPAPCDSYGYVFHSLLECGLEALSHIAPERCPAGSGNVFGCFIFRLDPQYGDPFIMIDATTVGWGGRPTGDGPNLIFLLDGDTPNVPGEVIETRYPLRMTRHAWKTDVIGHGMHRGGPGLVREFEMLGDKMFAQAAMENHHSPPAGIDGGLDAPPQQIVMWVGSDREQVFHERFAFVGPLDRGERLRTEAGGGGGWGNPAKREPERVLDDLRNEFVTLEVARETYRVAARAVGDDYELDLAETERLRAEV
jgi:N-methylhydantoinase B